MDSNEDRVKLCIKRHPDWPDGRISNSLNIRMKEIEAIRLGIPVASQESAAAPVAGVGAAVSMSDVRQKLDTAAAIRREIVAIKRDHLVPEEELCRLTAGRDRNRFRRAVDNNPELARAHRIKLRLDESTEGKFFWGHAEDITEAARLRDL